MKAHLFILLLSAIFVSKSVFSEHVVQEENELFFGTLMLGQSIDDIPASFEKLENCYISVEPKYFDCEFVDNYGTRYLVEGDTVIRKEIIMDTSKLDHYPIGIEKGDKFQDVINKISASEVKHHIWHMNLQNSEKFLVVEYISKFYQEVEWSYYIMFDGNNVVKLIGVRLNWN